MAVLVTGHTPKAPEVLLPHAFNHIAVMRLLGAFALTGALGKQPAATLLGYHCLLSSLGMKEDPKAAVAYDVRLRRDVLGARRDGSDPDEAAGLLAHRQDDLWQEVAREELHCAVPSCKSIFRRSQSTLPCWTTNQPTTSCRQKTRPSAFEAINRCDTLRTTEGVARMPGYRYCCRVQRLR